MHAGKKEEGRTLIIKPVKPLQVRKMMKSSQIGARKQAAVSCAELRIIFCKFAAVISSCLTLHPTGEVTATNSH